MFYNKLSLVLIICSQLLLSTLIADTNKRTFYLGAVRSCPFNCQDYTQYQGYVVDIMRQVFEDVGFNLDYKVSSLDKCLNDLKKEKLTGLILTNPLNSYHDFVFTKEPLGYVKFAFITRKDDKIDTMDAEKLKGKKIGLTRRFLYSPKIEASVQKEPQNVYDLSPELSFNEKAQLLLDGKFDVLIEVAQIAQYELEIVSGFLKPIITKSVQNSVKISGYEETRVPIRIAFSSEEPLAKTYAATIDRGIELLREDGRLGHILDVYGLQDWKK